MSRDWGLTSPIDVRLKCPQIYSAVKTNLSLIQALRVWPLTGCQAGLTCLSPPQTSRLIQFSIPVLTHCHTGRHTHLCCGFYTWCPNSVCPLCVHTGTGSGKSFMCATVTGSHWRAGGRLHIYISDFVSVSLSRGSSLSLVTLSFVIIYYNVSGLHQPDGWEALRWFSAQTHKLSLMSSRSQETKPLMAPPAPRPEELTENSWIISSEWQLKHLKPVEFSCFLNDLKELFQARGSRREITTSVIPSERERERESSHNDVRHVRSQ